MTRLQAVVKKGKAVGAVLTPHVHADGNYVVSLTKFERDYIRIGSESDLNQWVSEGYGVRMSNRAVPSHRSPSFVCAASLVAATPSLP